MERKEAMNEQEKVLYDDVRGALNNVRAEAQKQQLDEVEQTFMRYFLDDAMRLRTTLGLRIISVTILETHAVVAFTDRNGKPKHLAYIKDSGSKPLTISAVADKVRRAAPVEDPRDIVRRELQNAQRRAHIERRDVVDPLKGKRMPAYGPIDELMETLEGDAREKVDEHGKDNNGEK